MEPQFKPREETKGKAPESDDVRWVQRMALAIAGRTAAADDLVQEAWLVALHAEVELSSEKRGWWFGTMRNLQRRERRSDARRADRERKRELPRAVAPSAEEVYLRAEAQQRIAAAALRLDEPLRSTLLLRFFDGMPVAEIARQHDVKADSVRARLRRAIKLLQADLDSGEDPGWRHDLALALPLGFRLKTLSTASSSGAVSLSFLGGSFMLGKATLALALVAAMAVTAWLTLRSPSIAADVAQSPVHPEPASQGIVQGLGIDAASSQTDRSKPRSAESSNSDPASPGSSHQALSSLSGVPITIVLPDGTQRSDASGSFTLTEAGEGAPNGSAHSSRVDFSLGSFDATFPTSSALHAHSFVMMAPGPARRSLEETVWTASSPATEGSNRPTSTGDSEWIVPVEALATVHVSNDENADPLGGLVAMVGPKAWARPPYLGPGDRDALVIAEGESPLVIPMREYAGEEVDLWIGGQGRGWKSCTVPGSADSQTVLALASGGELELRFDAQLPDGCEIALVRLDYPQKIRVDMGDDWIGSLKPIRRHVMTGVVPGLYNVTVRFGPPHAQAPLTREIARAKATIVAGERTILELTGAQPGDDPPRTDVTIRLKVSPEWNLNECYLRLNPLRAGWEIKRRQWTEVDLAFDSEGVVEVEAEDVVVGTYLLEFFAVNMLAQTARVEVSENAPLLDFQVADPTELRLWVVDADSGVNVDVTHLSIGPPTPDGAQGRITPMSIPDRGPTGAFVLTVPGGPQRLSLRLADDRYVERALHITQNPTEVVIEVRD